MLGFLIFLLLSFSSSPLLGMADWRQPLVILHFGSGFYLLSISLFFFWFFRWDRYTYGYRRQAQVFREKHGLYITAHTA